MAKLFWVVYDTVTEETESVPYVSIERPGCVEDAAAFVAQSYRTHSYCEEYDDPIHSCHPAGGVWGFWGFMPISWTSNPEIALWVAQGHLQQGDKPLGALVGSSSLDPEGGKIMACLVERDE